MVHIAIHETDWEPLLPSPTSEHPSHNTRRVFNTGKLLLLCVVSLLVSIGGIWLFYQTHSDHVLRVIDEMGYSIQPQLHTVLATRLRNPIVFTGANLSLLKYQQLDVTLNGTSCYEVEITEDQLTCHMLWTYPFIPLLQQSGPVNISIISLHHRLQSLLWFERIIGHWEKQDIVLQLHFNSPRYHRLDMLPYDRIFPLVAVSGPREGNGSQPDIDCPEGKYGFQPFVCLAECIRLHPNHAGYMQLHFDAAVRFFKLEQHPLNTIWLQNPTYYTPRATLWSVSHNDTFNNVIAEMRNHSDIWQEELNKYETHVGFDRLINSLAELYYLPQRYTTRFIKVAERGSILDRHKMFGEVAVAVISAMIADTADWPLLPTSNHNHNLSVVEHDFWNEPDTVVFHKIDLSATWGERIMNVTFERNCNVSNTS